MDYEASDSFIHQKMVWLEKKNSRSFILMKLQQAFCSLQFTGRQSEMLEGDEINQAGLEQAIKVLVTMDSRSGYPQILGFELMNRLLKDA